MSSVAELYALQEVDLALAESRDALADVEARLKEPDELLEARSAVAEGEEAARSAEWAFNEQEALADGLREKIEPIERKLYEGGVHNPKELEDLQLDLDSLRRRRGDLEDQALEAMVALEKAQQGLAEARQRDREISDSWQEEQQELRERKAELEEEITSLEERRREQAAAVDGSLRQLYDRLSATREGRAVARVEGGACQGCRISLPMNLIQRARSGGQVVQCSNCERVLYVG